MQTYETILPPWQNFASEKEKEKVIDSKSKVIPSPQIVGGGGITCSFFKKTFGIFYKLLALFWNVEQILLFTKQFKSQRLHHVMISSSDWSKISLTSRYHCHLENSKEGWNSE